MESIMEEKMKSAKECPTRRQEPMQGTISFDADTKDIVKLSKRQKKVYDLLLTGKHSVTDITIALGYGDPRSYVRDIREKGITVNDEWIEKGEVRYKVYWIESEMRSCETLEVSSLKNTRYGR